MPSRYSYFLAHHGIQGQKWGKRNGPPYPISTESSSVIKNKAQVTNYLKDRAKWKQDIANEIIKKHRFDAVGSALISEHDQVWEEMVTNRGTNLDDILNTSVTEISYQYDPNGEKWASPTAVAHDIVERAKNNGFDDMNWSSGGIDHLEKNIGALNPDFGSPGTTQNCAKNTFAAELTRRGIDDIQAGRQTFPASADAMSYWFVGAYRDRYTNNEEGAISLINSFGEKSSGALCVYTEDGSNGHMVHWTKEGQRFNIEDGQIGRVYNGSDFKSALKEFTSDQPFSTKTLDITRLDDCEINWAHAEEDGCLRGNRVWNHETKRVVGSW